MKSKTTVARKRTRPFLLDPRIFSIIRGIDFSVDTLKQNHQFDKNSEMNIRTWHRLCISSYLGFPGMVMVWSLPNSSHLNWLALAMIVWAIGVGILGAVLGLLLMFGRLKLGCPQCNARSDVSGGNNKGMHLSCPKCGELEVQIGSIRGLKILRLQHEEEDEISVSARTSPMKILKRLGISMAVLVALYMLLPFLVFDFTELANPYDEENFGSQQVAIGPKPRWWIPKAARKLDIPGGYSYDPSGWPFVLWKPLCVAFVKSKGYALPAEWR